jgi:predicted transcriptional regulator
MNELDEILISLKPKHADQIFDGVKTVELRKRRLKIDAGTRVWIYATAPIAAIRGYANLVRIEVGSPLQIWKVLGSKTGISKSEFESYFETSELAYGLVLDDVMKMKHALPLTGVRKALNDFHPPQFYCHLDGTKNLMRLSSRKYEPVKK